MVIVEPAGAVLTPKAVLVKTAPGGTLWAWGRPRRIEGHPGTGCRGVLGIALGARVASVVAKSQRRCSDVWNGS